jgi:hypothetical protein
MDNEELEDYLRNKGYEIIDIRWFKDKLCVISGKQSDVARIVRDMTSKRRLQYHSQQTVGDLTIIKML